MTEDKIKEIFDKHSQNTSMNLDNFKLAYNEISEIFIQKFGRNCRCCDNTGITSDHARDHSCYAGSHNNCPVQIQCHWCHTEPRSKFNLRKLLVIN